MLLEEYLSKIKGDNDLLEWKHKSVCFLLLTERLRNEINLNIMEVEATDNRFEFIEKKGLMEGTRIIVDKETGVQYLLAHWTNIGGLTVLVDKDGKPLLDPRYVK